MDSSLRTMNLTGFSKLEFLSLQNGSILVDSKITYTDLNGYTQDYIGTMLRPALTATISTNPSSYDKINLSSVTVTNFIVPMFTHTFFVYMQVNGSRNISNQTQFNPFFKQFQEFVTTSVANLTMTTQLEIIRSSSKSRLYDLARYYANTARVYTNYSEFVSKITLVNTNIFNVTLAQEALLAALNGYNGTFPVIKGSIKIVTFDYLFTTTVAPLVTESDNNKVNVVAIVLPIVIVLVVVIGFAALFCCKLKKSVSIKYMTRFIFKHEIFFLEFNPK